MSLGYNFQKTLQKKSRNPKLQAYFKMKVFKCNKYINTIFRKRAVFVKQFRTKHVNLVSLASLVYKLKQILNQNEA